MQISRFTNGHCSPMFCHHLHPGRGVDLHQGVGDEHHVHPVKDGGQHGMPEADFPLEIQHTHHNFP